MLELSWEIVDNTRYIDSRVIEMVKANHKTTMQMIADLAKTRCPVDTGALRASIYTVGPWGSGYTKAVAEAASQQGTRIVERNQILPQLILGNDLRQSRGVWLAAVDVPLAYAITVHNGYYNFITESVTPPNPFLLTEFMEVWNSNIFLKMCQKDFQSILKS